MPQARHATRMLLSLVVLVAGCYGGNNDSQNSPPPPPPPTSGLDARPGNTTCIAPERDTGSVTIAQERVFPNLRFTEPGTFDSRNPLWVGQAPGDSSRWFVLERFGTARVFDSNPNVSTSSLFLDISARVESSCAECGLLGMAFHPNFPTDPRVYITYTSVTHTTGGPDTHLSEFTSRDGGLTLDPASERVIIRINKPNVHHHGGTIIFGSDGNLWFGAGDGNSASRNDAQTLTTLLGKIIRIDIRGTTGSALYRIPSDNPFASSTALCNEGGNGPQNCPEIWAWGFRNPWRWSFDRQTGDIWAGDVGEATIEEVDRVERRGNYGWKCFEGTRNTGLNCGTPTGPLLPPIAQYDHTIGQAVTGGYVYRGTRYPALVGKYIFADFVSGVIWAIPNDAQPTMTMTTGLETGLLVSSFGEGNDGEIYFTNMRGDLHHITAASSGGGAGVATKLSDTGCVDASNPTQPASGLIPYAPNAAFWSDGAVKERWIGLPDGQNITVGADGDWDFPNGTVLMKNFHLGSTLVETRLFMRHPDGVWAGYSYEWNAQQTDATLVRGGKRVTVAGQTWIYPSEAQCMQCHTEAAGRSLGLETRQLAFNITYPQTGRDANQLVTLNHINVLSPPLANPEDEAPYPAPNGTAGTLTERARSYLHTNCSQCHRPGGPTTSNMDLRYTTSLADTHACDVAPTLDDLGISNPRLIAPGAPDRSIVPARMNLRGTADQMPPVGSAQVDTDGVTLIRDWISSLTSCN